MTTCDGSDILEFGIFVKPRIKIFIFYFSSVLETEERVYRLGKQGLLRRHLWRAINQQGYICISAVIDTAERANTVRMGILFMHLRCRSTRNTAFSWSVYKCIVQRYKHFIRIKTACLYEVSRVSGGVTFCFQRIASQCAYYIIVT
jgi:hypothetical protein